MRKSTDGLFSACRGHWGCGWQQNGWGGWKQFGLTGEQGVVDHPLQLRRARRGWGEGCAAAATPEAGGGHHGVPVDRRWGGGASGGRGVPKLGRVHWHLGSAHSQQMLLLPGRGPAGPPVLYVLLGMAQVLGHHAPWRTCHIWKGRGRGRVVGGACC